MTAARIARVLLAAILLLASGLAASAHPHVFVKAKTEVLFDAQGRITGVRQAWQFDDAYSAFASQGLDSKHDGKPTVQDLAPLAKLNIDSLKDYAYFTFLGVGKDDIDFGEPRNYWVQSDGGLLTLYFELPTARPVEIKGKATRLEVYDPTYFVAFEFVPDNPLKLVDAPAGCTFKITRPEELDPAVAAQLAQIPADQREVPPELMVVTQTLTNGADLKCP